MRSNVINCPLIVCLNLFFLLFSITLLGTFAALAIMTGAISRQVHDYQAMMPPSDQTDGQNKTLSYSNAEIAIICSFMVGIYQLLFGESTPRQLPSSVYFYLIIYFQAS